MSQQTNDSRDGFESRLLLFVKNFTGIAFKKIRRIKQGVWLIQSNNHQLILKEYSRKSALTAQIKLIEQLINHGFNKTYVIYKKPIVLENRIFGFVQYIASAKSQPFHYNSKKNMTEALNILTEFHDTTENFAHRFLSDIPSFHLINKWSRRFEDFEQNIHIHRYSPVYSHLKMFSQMGKWALHEMYKGESFFIDKPHCIIHGDVASHNFIKGNDGKLYLIDFDLIGIAPRHIDLLQICNRMLPSLQWNVKQLFRLPYLKAFENNRPFLAALVYPADIYREWLQFLNSNQTIQEQKWPMIKNIIFSQYKERIECLKWLMEKVESMK